MTMDDDLPDYATITDTASRMGISRQRLHQLQRDGVVPLPIYHIETRRPFYDRRLQQICLEVRRRNRGINGKPILFYSRRTSVPAKAPKRKPSKPKPRPSKSPSKYAGIVDALATLGVETTQAVVEKAVGELFPKGAEDLDDGEILPPVFRHLRSKKGKNTGDSVG
jgi:hypothetical protein